jgi:hypothetical protein
MKGWGRRAVRAAASVLVFCVCLWLFRFAHFGWLPRSEADRWVVAVGLGTVAAAAVLELFKDWANGTDGGDGTDHDGGADSPGQPQPQSQPARRATDARVMKVKQRAKASGHGRITQIGGDQHVREP